MKKLSIYFTPGHFSITVANGAMREVSGATPLEVLPAMAKEDRATLDAFCRAVLEFGNSGKFPLVVE